jgi:hypothetical protein
MKNNPTDFLSMYIEMDRATKDPQFNLDNPEICNFCAAPFATQQFLIDGEAKNTVQIPLGNGESMGQWAYMCSKCFQARGVSIKWGKGQLYKKTLDNKWLLVGGFPPE